MKNHIVRPRQYVTGISYWSNPNAAQNDKDSYLDMSVRTKYSNSLVESLKQYYKPEDKFSLHELGCGWGTNLGVIKENFQNVVITANDVWKDAIDYVKINRPYVDLTEKDTFEFINDAVENKKSFDVIITNAHLIHIADNDLVGLSGLHKICKRAILQENIRNLEFLVTNMKLANMKTVNLPDSNYRYIFENEI